MIAIRILLRAVGLEYVEERTRVIKYLESRRSDYYAINVYMYIDV